MGISCSFPLFDQLSISGVVSSQNDDNKMLGLWSSDASASHEWVKNNVGALFGINEIPDAVINMNEGHFYGAGSDTNEYCYWNADVVLFINSDCNGQIQGVNGNNVMSSFKLTYKLGLNSDLFDAILIESMSNAVGFNLELHQLLLENGHFIWCSGGLTLTSLTISCLFPLFDQLSIIGVISRENDNNKMLGLWSVRSTNTHDWVKNRVGVLFGNNNQIPDAVITMNEGDFYGQGSNTNEYCYWNGDVVYFVSSDCNGRKGMNGNNVLSSFTLTYTSGINSNLIDDGSVPIPTQLPTQLPTTAPTQPTKLPTKLPTTVYDPYINDVENMVYKGAGSSCRGGLTCNNQFILCLPRDNEPGTFLGTPYKSSEHRYSVDECLQECANDQRCFGAEFVADAYSATGDCNLIFTTSPVDITPPIGNFNYNSTTVYDNLDRSLTGGEALCFQKEEECYPYFEADERLKKAHANRMFHLCSAWCLYQTENPESESWLWNPTGLCWKKQGPTGHCNTGATDTELEFVKHRSTLFCQHD